MGPVTRFIFLLFIFVLAAACDNGGTVSLKKDADQITADELIPDNDTVVSTGTITAVNFRRIHTDASELLPRTLVQNASADMTTGEVTRTFGFTDTSFTLHADDRALLAQKLLALLPALSPAATEPLSEEESISITYALNGETISKIFIPAEQPGLTALLDTYLSLPYRKLPWPFDPQTSSHPVGHIPASYQNYSIGTADAYFHQGVDIVLPEPVAVFNIADGRIVKIGHYKTDGTDGGSDPMYYQIVVETLNGLTIQYHHIDKTTVPAEIKQTMLNKEILKAGTEIGQIVYWPVKENGYSKQNFHHLHLNIMNRAMRPLNGMLLLTPAEDSVPPEITTVTLTDAARTKALDPAAVSEDFHVIAEVSDKIGEGVWPLPPRITTLRIEAGETPSFTHIGYDFLAIPGNTFKDFICSYYLCELGDLTTAGNYDTRRFLITVTAFAEDGSEGAAVPVASLPEGENTLHVISCDDLLNCAEASLPITIVR